MALSNENPNASTDADRMIAFKVARGQAKALAQALINYERNPDPMRHREAPSPALGVRIIDPTRDAQLRGSVFGGHVPIDQEIRDHNSLVANLGVMPK